MIDSFVAGIERLMHLGNRNSLSTRTRRHIPVNGIGAEQDVTYIDCVQEIFRGRFSPSVPPSSYGSVLVRCPTLKEKNVLERGEVGGIVRITQTQINYRPDFYIILADSFQPLIDDGWEVDQFKENGDEALDDDQNDSDNGIESGL
jgi:hypothetical protein